MILIDTFQVNPHALAVRARWVIADNYHGVKYTRGEGQPRWASWQPTIISNARASF